MYCRSTDMSLERLENALVNDSNNDEMYWQVCFFFQRSLYTKSDQLSQKNLIKRQIINYINSFQTVIYLSVITNEIILQFDLLIEHDLHTVLTLRHA